MPTIQHDGVSFHYLEAGQGPVLALLHGFPLDSTVWEEQVRALSDRYRVVALDQRGFGRSRCESAFTLESLADDAHAILGKLNALPCVLAGLSMGGYVALSFVRKYPRSLRGLVLVDTKAAADTPEAKLNRMKMVEAVRADGSAKIAAMMMPNMLAPQALSGRPDLVDRLRRIMEGCPPRTIEHALLAMRDREDHTPALGSINVPAQVIVGEHDAITPPAVMDLVARAIPGAAMTVVEGAGHMAPMERPDAVSRVLWAFLDSIDRPRMGPTAG